MIKKLQKMNEFMESKTMSAIDWTLSSGVLLYGAYLIYSTGINTSSIITTSVGAIGLLLAYIKPAKLIKRKMENSILKRGV